MVPAIGMGCFSFGGDRKTGSHLSPDMEALHKGVWGEQSDEATFSTVNAALKAGINFFDTAEMYGDGYSEEMLGKALKASGVPREKYMVATKVCETYLAPADLRAHLDASLARLQLEYIDVYQIHWHSRAAVTCEAYPERPLKAEIPLEATMKELAKLKEEGKIKHIGVCNFGPEDIRTLLKIGVPIISNQLSYGLLWRGIENEVMQLCAENGIGIMAWGSLQQGLLCGKFKTADNVPPGRARNRLFSNARPQQRHGEPGLETEAFAAVEEIRQIAAGIGRPMAEVSLAWTLQQPNMTMCLMGARNGDMLESNLPAAENKLDAATLEKLNVATNDVKVKLGANLDPYETLANTRIV